MQNWQYGPHMREAGPFGGGHGWESVFGLFFMIAIVALLVLGIVLIVRALTHRGHGGGAPAGAIAVAPGPGARSAYYPAAPPNAEALRILDERYARGDIEREEFFQRRHDLMGTPPAGPTGVDRPAVSLAPPSGSQPPGA